jgi:hypothetical protein
MQAESQPQWAGALPRWSMTYLLYGFGKRPNAPDCSSALWDDIHARARTGRILRSKYSKSKMVNINSAAQYILTNAALSTDLVLTSSTLNDSLVITTINSPLPLYSQLWYFSPIPNNDSYYRLRTVEKGPTNCLDMNNVRLSPFPGRVRSLKLASTVLRPPKPRPPLLQRR